MSASPQNPQPEWTPLNLLRRRFESNVIALAGRYAQLAMELENFTPEKKYSIRVDGNVVKLGFSDGDTIQAVPSVVTPHAAHDLVAKIFPNKISGQSLLINGEDLGWLWNSLYQLPTGIAHAPGHRPPFFFLIKDVERLWVILHLQDWQALLADPRVRLFAGPTAYEDFRRSLAEDLLCPFPKMSVNVDPTIWPAGLTLDAFLNDARQVLENDYIKTRRQLDVIYHSLTPQLLADKFKSGERLKILGITSRYTTFLQYSMRDWLAAFEKLGHTTRLQIEQFDHEVPNSVVTAKQCADFLPDLVVVIDHYRNEIGGVPDNVPMVMWVQDRMPNIYSETAGRAQARLDYTIGYSYLELTQNFGYPASRFLPTMMAVNPARFSPRNLTAAQMNRHRCDVSFVSNCTMPADQIVREEAAKIGSPLAVRLFDAIYQKFKAIYDAGGFVTSGDIMRTMVQQTVVEQQVNTNVESLLQVFSQRVNNSLFRHQAIRWVAEMGVNLHLYGKGWENHPEFSKYARGVADNLAQLPSIYQASSINLQATPFGAVHQRLLDGLSAGGFFLLRSVTQDDLELLLRDMGNWCRANNVRSAGEMIARQDETLRAHAGRYLELGGIDPLSNPNYFFGAFEEVALSGYSRTANTLWSDSSRVTFSSREQVQLLVAHFLKNPRERREIAASMRQRVLETHTYESIAGRMLNFIAADLEADRRKTPRAAAA